MDKQYMEIVINLETGQIDLEGHYINHNSQCIRSQSPLNQVNHSDKIIIYLKE